MWGLDITGSFPIGMSNKRFFHVGTGYFTKWFVLVSLANIAVSNVKTFLWKNIVTRFWIPNALVSDNETQFKCQKIEEFCRQYSMKQYFSSVSYLQGNNFVDI